MIRRILFIPAVIGLLIFSCVVAIVSIFYWIITGKDFLDFMNNVIDDFIKFYIYGHTKK